LAELDTEITRPQNALQELIFPLDCIAERTMRFGRSTILLITVSLWSIVGCRQANSVSGTVTYNGEPVEDGSVTFTSADGSGPGFGAQVVNGQYKADKVRLGKHVASVRGLTKAPVLTKEESVKAHERRDNRYGLPIDYIPEDATGNRETFEIERGKQTLDFALKGPPRSG
jgi:hypothetical protein